MLINLKQLLDHAAGHEYAVAGFNVYNIETIRAVYEVSHELNSPVLLQLSSMARQYAGDEVIFKTIRGFHDRYPHLPLVIHQDHGHNLEICESAVRYGATSVMRDGSLAEDKKTPLSFDDNVRVTKEAVDRLSLLGVSVEGELGCLGSLATLTSAEEDGHGAKGHLNRSQLLTDPDEAAEFCRLTGVTALAVAIGTSHGAHKFPTPPDEYLLDLKQLSKIAMACPNTHLVLHGASSVPHSLQDAFNQFGGELQFSWGVPDNMIKEAVRLGIRKINIDTDCRLAFTVGVRKYLQMNRSSFDPRGYLQAGVDGMKDVIRHKLVLLNQAGQASHWSKGG